MCCRARQFLSRGYTACAVERIGLCRSATRALLHALEKATASEARPSPAASTRRPILHQFRSHKSCVRPFTGWVRARMAALLSTRWSQQRRRERGRLGRINATSDLTTSFVHANPAPESRPAGCGQEWPRSCTRSKRQRRRERGRPRPHQHDDRSYTCFDQANPAAER